MQEYPKCLYKTSALDLSMVVVDADAQREAENDGWMTVEALNASGAEDTKQDQPITAKKRKSKD